MVKQALIRDADGLGQPHSTDSARWGTHRQTAHVIRTTIHQPVCCSFNPAGRGAAGIRISDPCASSNPT